MKQIYLLITIISIYRYTTHGLAFFWAIYFVKLGFSGYQIGILFAMFAITTLFIPLPTGIFSDRITPKKLILAGLGLVLIELYFASIATSFIAFVCILLIGGIGDNIFKVSTNSLFFKILDKKRKERTINWYLSIGYIAIGTALILNGALLEKISFPILLNILTVIIGALGIITLFLPDTKTFKYQLFQYKQDVFKKETLFFILIIFLFALHFGSEQTSYSLFLRNNLGLSLMQTGLYMGIAVMTMAISVTVASKLIKKVDIKKILYSGLILSGIGYIIVAYPNTAISFPGRIIHEIGDAIMFVFLYNSIAKFFPKARVGGSSSLMTLTLITGLFISSLVSGPLGTAYGYQWPIILSGISTLGAFGVAVGYKRLIT